LPLNEAVDVIINAIPLPNLPFPELPDLDSIKLPIPNFPTLPNLTVPELFELLVPPDLSELLEDVKSGSLDFDSVINVTRLAFVSTKN
jgi:hypothetical protein